MSKNVVELEGNVYKDIALMGDKCTFCYINIAVNRVKGGADFLSVKAFKELAESCAKNLVKGDSISVVGHISSGSYDKDGVKHYTTDIIAETIKKLPKQISKAVEVETA